MTLCKIRNFSRNLKITPVTGSIILTNHAGPCQLQVLSVLTTEIAVAVIRIKLP